MRSKAPQRLDPRQPRSRPGRNPSQDALTHYTNRPGSDALWIGARFAARICVWRTCMLVIVDTWGDNGKAHPCSVSISATSPSTCSRHRFPLSHIGCSCIQGKVTTSGSNRPFSTSFPPIPCSGSAMCSTIRWRWCVLVNRPSVC